MSWHALPSLKSEGPAHGKPKSCSMSHASAWGMKVGWKLTRNQDLHVVHVDNADAFVSSISHRVLPGDTLVADYIYFLHPVSHLLFKKKSFICV